jgi:hypothetical protein
MKLLIGISVFILIIFVNAAEAVPSFTSLQSFSISANTGEKPQSKIWTYDGNWWAVMPYSTGTKLWRLDGTTWTNVLHLSNSANTFADTKVIGNITHILLYRGTTSELVSVEYVPSTHTYKLWTVRSTTVTINLDAGVETATIDIDSYGRMWLASDASTTVNVRWSDSPYSSWSSAITIASGISTDDISVITAMPTGKIGVLWSNQSTQRFGFRTHIDGTDPNTWTADEVPASQSAQNVGAGMADDHLNLAVASDGTLYAAVKTSYDATGYPKIALLVRRPSGTWDNLYEVDQAGTRGIILLNEEEGILMQVYTSSEGYNNIVYKQSSLSPISFGPRNTIISGGVNDVTSTKQNFTSELVLLASSASSAFGVIRKNTPPIPPAIVGRWQMEEGSGSLINDSSPYNNHGNLIGSPSWVSGVTYGSALSLNGSSQYAFIPDSPSLNITQAITLMAWIKPAVTGTQYIIKKAVIAATDGYELSLSSAGTVFVRFNQATQANIFRIDSKRMYSDILNSWIHIAATYNGSVIRLYVDGIEDSASAASFSIATNNLSLGIGAQSDGTTLFNGCIDDARIYNYALSPVEIQAILEQALPIQLASLTAELNPIGEGVLLKWTTISEKNNYGFFVERHSEDETNFTEVMNSFVPGNGTTLDSRTYTFLDNSLSGTGTHHYRLRQVDNDGLVHYSHSISLNVTTLAAAEEAPNGFQLYQNYPNPFNPTTTIKFNVDKSEHTKISVSNILGQEVAQIFDGIAQPGYYYSFKIDGSKMNSGIYYYRLQTETRTEIKKMLLIK